MRGIAPWISRMLTGVFETDLSPVKANEFFTTAPYNGLVESMYDLINAVDSSRAVFNPAMPEVSAGIMTDNPSPAAAPGRQHSLQDTYIKFEDHFNGALSNGYVALTHVNRFTEASEASPFRVFYGPGDLSLQNPYVFAAVNVASGAEQYFVAEYIMDELDVTRRYSSVLELILELVPEPEYASVVEIFTGDVISETTALDGTITRPVKFRLRFGADATVADMITALNAFTFESDNVFRAALKVVSGGIAQPGKKIIDMFRFYSDDVPPELQATTKVLRFIPPVPSVRIASPNTFLASLFNVTSPGTQRNLAAYVLLGGKKVFVNTGTYGFVLKKQYDEAGTLTFPSQITVDTIDGDPVLLYVPNKVKSYHYTLTDPVTPDWFSSASPLLTGFFSSVDMDMNYFFLPFLKVTDSTLTFASGFSIHIDSIPESAVADISTPGLYVPALLESLVRYDITTMTSPHYTKMAGLFETFKSFLGYAGADVLNDEESALLRTSEYAIGLGWYYNNVVWIDPALGVLPSDDRPWLKVYRDLSTASAAGIIKPGTVVVHIVGDPAVADSTDAFRLDPGNRPFPAGLPAGVRHLVLMPSDNSKCPGDDGFTISDAVPGRVLFSYTVSTSGGEAVILDGQDFSLSEYTGFLVTNPDTGLDTPLVVRGGNFRRLQFEAVDAEGAEVEGLWNVSLHIESDNVIGEFLHKGYVTVTDFVNPYDDEGDPYPWRDDLTDTRNSIHEIVLASTDVADAVNGSITHAVLASRLVHDPDADLYGGYPTAIGVLIDPSFVISADVTASSILFTNCTPFKRKCTCTYTPMFMPFALGAVVLPGDIAARLYAERITAFDSPYAMDLDLSFSFVIDHRYELHEGERRTKALLTSLIYVASEISGSDIKVTVMDGSAPFPDDPGLDWHTFDPGYFLVSADPLNVFADTFLFLDCGMHVQIETEVVSGGMLPLLKVIEHRGGRLVDSRFTLELHGICARDAAGALRFFASRMFRRSPYLFYFGDQHPVYSYTLRKLSRGLDFKFVLPNYTTSYGDTGTVELTTLAPVKVIGEWSFDPSSPGSAYPRLPAVYGALPPSLSVLKANTHNWVASKAFIAGLADSKVNMPSMVYSPIQYMTPAGYTSTVNSSLAILEDCPGTEMKIPRLNTLYESAHDYDSSRTLAAETTRGFNLTTTTFIEYPYLNLGTKLEVAQWFNQALTTGITGGRDMTVKLNYECYTVGTLGVMYNDAQIYDFPIRPWFHLCGVVNSDISLRNAPAYGNSGGVWPMGETVGADILPRMELMRIAATTPTFITANTRILMRRPMRVVVGLLFQHYDDVTFAVVNKAASSSGNRGYIYATRLNLVLGGENKFEGFVHGLSDQYPYSGDEMVHATFPLTLLAPDISVEGVAGVHKLVLNTLSIFGGANVAHYLNRVMCTNDNLKSTTSPDNEILARVNSMITGWNPCYLSVIPVVKETGALSTLFATDWPGV